MNGKPTHITRGNVLDDLGFSPENATAMKFKAKLYRAILKYARKTTQKCGTWPKASNSFRRPKSSSTGSKPPSKTIPAIGLA